jgi:hypothetical protein
MIDARERMIRLVPINGNIDVPGRATRSPCLRDRVEPCDVRQNPLAAAEMII